jgi:hypothetical protein
MSITVELRGDGGAASTGRLAASANARWILAGAALIALDLICVAPGNPLLDFNKSGLRRAGTFVSHLGVLLLLVGIWPARRRWLDAIGRARPFWGAVALALCAVLPVMAVGGVGGFWPAYAHALCKEFGPIEPATVGVYLVAAWVAAETARLRRGRGLPWRPFWLLAAACVVLSLEEVDYFGIPSAIMGGRIGHVYVGSIHDLFNLATWYPMVLPILGLAALVALGVAWRAAGLSLRFLWAEARHVSSWVMVAGLLVIAAAELVDITSDVPAGLEPLYRADVEEPLELGGAALIGAGVLLKYLRDRGEGGSRVG